MTSNVSIIGVGVSLIPVAGTTGTTGATGATGPTGPTGLQVQPALRDRLGHWADGRDRADRTVGREISADPCYGMSGNTGARIMPRGRNQGIDLTGRKFGRLTVVGTNPRSGGHGYWECRCDCGNAVFTDGHKLATGQKKSCGCLVSGPRAERLVTEEARQMRMAFVVASKEDREDAGPLLPCWMR